MLTEHILVRNFFNPILSYFYLLLLYVCIFTHVCVFMFVCVCECGRVSRDQRYVGALPQELSSVVFDTGSLTGLRFAS